MNGTPLNCFCDIEFTNFFLLFLIFFGTIKSSVNAETIESFNETISCSNKAGMASIYVDEALYDLYLQTNFNRLIQNISGKQHIEI